MAFLWDFSSIWANKIMSLLRSAIKFYDFWTCLSKIRFHWCEKKRALKYGIWKETRKHPTWCFVCLWVRHIQRTVNDCKRFDLVADFIRMDKYDVCSMCILQAHTCELRTVGCAIRRTNTIKYHVIDVFRLSFLCFFFSSSCRLVSFRRFFNRSRHVHMANRCELKWRDAFFALLGSNKAMWTFLRVSFFVHIRFNLSSVNCPITCRLCLLIIQHTRQSKNVAIQQRMSHAILQHCIRIINVPKATWADDLNGTAFFSSIAV